jgi:integrase
MNSPNHHVTDSLARNQLRRDGTRTREDMRTRHKHLTDAFVKALTPPDRGNRITYDDKASGFGIRVTAAGAKAFILRYRVRGNGQQRTITIGRYPDWQVSAARDEAKRLRGDIDRGGDPLGDIEQTRAAPTMTDLIQRFTDEHLPRKRPATAGYYRLILRNHIAPHFGLHTKVADVRFADVDALHRKITRAGSPYAANRTVAVVHKMFDLACRWQMRTDNPANHVERNVESKRKRYLSADELARLLKALAEYPNKKIANIFRLLLLTGARRGEVRSMRWADVDLEKGVWTKPASTTKTKTDHVVPLSAPARQLLAEIYAAQRGARSEWVFPSSRGDGHIIELQLDWVKLCKAAAITGLRTHDLRHSFASQLASGGASLPLIGALLGHSNLKSTDRYSHLFDDPQRAAVEKIGAIYSGAPAAETVTLPKRRR